jgi:DNA-binding NarL/FixJ family response regulator
MRAEPLAGIDHKNYSGKAQICVCIINDQAIVRAGLRMLIEDAGMNVVGEAANRSEAVAMARANPADIFLLDLDFVSDNGMALLSELVTTASGPVLVLTRSSNPEMHQLVVQNGARGIVLKEEDPEILLKAIKEVESGELWLRRSLLTDLITKQRSGLLSKQHKLDPEAEKISTLTSREREIIKLVAEGLNGKAIAGRLHLSEFTVRNHLTSILDKLELSNKFELAVYAFRHSLINKAQESST